MEKGVIKILGAGISGMSAAINLRKLGYEVKVYDIKNAPGKTTGDYQFLENWVWDTTELIFSDRSPVIMDLMINSNELAHA